MRRLLALRMEIWIAVLALLSGIFGFIFEKVFGLPISVILPVAFGFLLATSLSLLKFEISNQIDDRINIYHLYSQVKDEELKGFASKFISECEYRLLQLTRESVDLSSLEVFENIIERLNKSNKYMLATHIGVDIRAIYCWLEPDANQDWYDANKRAVERKVKVERVFIFRKNDIIDSEGKIKDPKVIDILNRQHNASINVYIAFIEEINNFELVEDYIVYDDREVLPMQLTWGKFGYKMKLKKSREDIRIYTSRFNTLKAISIRYNPESDTIG